MPFGEYVPLRDVLPYLDIIPAMVGEFTPGNDFTVTPIGADRIGSYICSESAEPGIARELARRGATIFVEVTNDAWFGPTPGPNQHLAHAIFRAVENGRPLVRVTNSGVTVLVEPDGQLIQPTSLFQAESRRWIIDSSAAATHMTIYTRFGDWLVVVCGAVCVLIFGWARLKTSRR
jgi:apolipoprotein N-acyltransferase